MPPLAVGPGDYTGLPALGRVHEIMYYFVIVHPRAGYEDQR